MEIDRTSIRSRPTGMPVMHQTWAKLLFMHWKVSAEAIQPHLPSGLAVDTFDGDAFVGITPFTMYGVRPVFMPSIPSISESHELNVRTYVHLDGVPGVWFISLDASNPLAVIGARLGFSLPYYRATMKLAEKGDTITFTSERNAYDGNVGRLNKLRPRSGITEPTNPNAEFEASWRLGDSLPEAQPGSLSYFLIERYCLYTLQRGKIKRSRIHHRPWPLRRAELLSWRSTMMESQGLPLPQDEPLVHAQASPLHVEVWPLERPRRTSTTA